MGAPRWSLLPLLVIVIATGVPNTQCDPVTDVTVTGMTDVTAATPVTGDLANDTATVTDDQASNDTATDVSTTIAPTTEEEEVDSGPPYVRCYMCDGVMTSDECNGVGTGENGSLQICDTVFPQCYVEVIVNPTADGYLIRKGCMDTDDCYDRMFDSLMETINLHCMSKVFSGLNGTLRAETWCFFCCMQSMHLDRCNRDAFMDLIPFPEENLWDPNMNWDFTMKEEPGGGASHVVVSNVAFLLGIIGCVVVAALL